MVYPHQWGVATQFSKVYFFLNQWFCLYQKWSVRIVPICIKKSDVEIRDREVRFKQLPDFLNILRVIDVAQGRL
jgi:hypothetical protein